MSSRHFPRAKMSSKHFSASLWGIFMLENVPGTFFPSENVFETFFRPGNVFETFQTHFLGPVRETSRHTFLSRYMSVRHFWNLSKTKSGAEDIGSDTENTFSIINLWHYGFFVMFPCVRNLNHCYGFCNPLTSNCA